MIEFSMPNINEDVLDIIAETIIATMSFVIMVLALIVGEVLTGIIWFVATILWILLIIRKYNYIKKELSGIATELAMLRKRYVWIDGNKINVKDLQL